MPTPRRRSRSVLRGILTSQLGSIRSITRYSCRAVNTKIEARLLFQSLSSRYVAELLSVDTPEVKSFAAAVFESKPCSRDYRHSNFKTDCAMIETTIGIAS